MGVARLKKAVFRALICGVVLSGAATKVLADEDQWRERLAAMAPAELSSRLEQIFVANRCVVRPSHRLDAAQEVTLAFARDLGMDDDMLRALAPFILEMVASHLGAMQRSGALELRPIYQDLRLTRCTGVALTENAERLARAIEALGCFNHFDTINEMARLAGMSLVDAAKAKLELRDILGFEVIVPGARPGQEHSLFTPLLGPAGVEYLRSEECLARQPDADALAFFDAMRAQGCVIDESTAQAVLETIGYQKPYLDVLNPDGFSLFGLYERIGQLMMNDLAEIRGATLVLTSEDCA